MKKREKKIFIGSNKCYSWITVAKSKFKYKGYKVWMRLFWKKNYAKH